MDYINTHVRMMSLYSPARTLSRQEYRRATKGRLLLELSVPVIEKMLRGLVRFSEMVRTTLLTLPRNARAR